MSVIEEPAAAIAAGRCLTARTIARPNQPAITSQHPRACGWCDYPLDALARMVSGFNAWAGFDERRGTYARHDARVFQALPRSEQEAQIESAQAFEPMDPTPPPPADAEEDVPAWMPR